MPKSLKERLEEAFRKKADKDTLLIKYIGDDLREPRPEVFREAIEWILELINEVEELRSRVDSMGFTVKENPSHHISCEDESCGFNKKNKCQFVAFSGERILKLDNLHVCVHWKKDPDWKGKVNEKPKKDDKSKKKTKKKKEEKKERIGEWEVVRKKK